MIIFDEDRADEFRAKDPHGRISRQEIVTAVAIQQVSEAVRSLRGNAIHDPVLEKVVDILNFIVEEGLLG